MFNESFNSFDHKGEVCRRSTGKERNDDFLLVTWLQFFKAGQTEFQNRFQENFVRIACVKHSAILSHCPAADLSKSSFLHCFFLAAFHAHDTSSD